MNSTYTISLKERPLSAFKSSILFKFQLIALLAMLMSTNAFAQTISIGSPNDGTEGGSPMSFIVSLDNGVINTTGSDITGTISAAGTATAGGDYLAPVSFAIPNGSNSIGVLAPIVDDPICEGTETAIFSISNPSVGSINPAASFVTTNIFDDDFCYIISISSSIPSAVEGSSDIVFDVFIDGGQLNNSAAPITGSIDYAGGATTPSDYIPVPTYSIPVGANSTTITVPVVDDAVIETTEPLTIILTGSPSVGSYGNTTATTTIIDDDAASLGISIGSPTDGAEGGAFVTYTISLDGGVINNTGSAITGSISYSGTATDGIDHSGTNIFTIPDGVGSTLIPVPVIDDGLLECSETVIATISNPSIGTINPTAASSTANITDDECSQITISVGSPVDGTEGGSDASFTISIDGGVINNTGFAIIGAMAFFGDAGAAFDYTPSATGFSIPDGQNSTVITLAVIDDACIETTESASLMISNPSIGTIANSTSSLNIFDNDSTAALISIGNPINGEENAIDVEFLILIDGGLSNCTGFPIVGDVSFSGTATEGADFTGVFSFTIPDGASFTTLTLPVIDDALDECDETVIPTISNPSIGAINSTSSSSTGIIIDDECTNSIEDLTDARFDVFPNPTRLELHIRSDKQMKTYSILDINGRLVQAGRIDGKEITVSLDAISSGSYFVEVELENGMLIRKKILKE